jgi:RNA polymerase sigma-70 factor (ECF subfamily)
MAETDNLRGSDDQVAYVQTEFIKHGDAVRGYLLALCPDENVADDLLHSVFLAVTQKAGDFERGTNFAAWARAIAKIEVLRLANRRARAPRLLSPDVIEMLSATAPQFQVESDRLLAMRTCLDNLTPRAKESITLRYLENLAPGAIAERMKLGVNSVNVMLSRARIALRECIERRLRSMENA